MPDMSEMPSMPGGMEMPDMSEMPPMPGGGFSGRRGMSPGSDDSEEERTFGRPDDENAEEKSDGKFDRNFGENKEESIEEETGFVSTAKNLSEYESSVWKYIAASVIVLASAVVAVRSFKRW